MHGLPGPNARRWYTASVILSLLAVVCSIVSQVVPRVGYPLAFAMTMCGLLAITRPSWERKEGRRRLVIINSSVFVVQFAILYAGLSAA